MKREFKPCVYCNTVTNHSFHFSHLELLLNVQKGKSNVPVNVLCMSVDCIQVSLVSCRYLYVLSMSVDCI